VHWFANHFFFQYIAVHVRRGDFTAPCKKKGIPVDKCVPSLKSFKAKVDQIRQQLLDDKKREVNAVVLMSGMLVKVLYTFG